MTRAVSARLACAEQIFEASLGRVEGLVTVMPILPFDSCFDDRRAREEIDVRSGNAVERRLLWGSPELA
jgi:hypothetical protein